MRLFDSSQINQLILAALKESPLKQADIVEKISVQLELTQEEREEKEIYSNMGIFYHKIAGQIQSLKRSGLIIHDDETKAWKILDIGKTELSNFDRVIDNNLQRLKSLESFSNDEIRGIILIPNSNNKDKTQTIKDALEGARKDLNIMLKFFSLTISFT